MNIETFSQAPGFTGLECLIKRSHFMRVQVVHNKANFYCFWVSIIKHLFDLLSPIFHGATFGHSHMPFASQRFYFHKYLNHAISYIFIIDTRRLSWLARNWCTYFTNQLLVGLIHTYHRIFRIIWQVVYLKDILHRRYKGCTPFWRDFPVLFEVRFKFIFFNTRCTVMCEIDDAKLSSTTLSANNLTVHRRCPAGASEQARAISRASNAPSNIISRGGLTRDLRTRAASIPSSTKRFFKCSMVRLVTPSATATSATFQAGPSGEALQSNNARAWMNFLAGVFPLRVNAFNSLRSWVVNVTRYRGAIATS